MWGKNDFGQLGLGNTTHYNTPQKLETISNISEIYCGGTFA
jgi:alpha-tubulin suppressor-like RCC1 family protein